MEHTKSIASLARIGADLTQTFCSVSAPAGLLVPAGTGTVPGEDDGCVSWLLFFASQRWRIGHFRVLPGV